MDAKDVLGDSCEQMLAAANSKRHAELITRLKELVKGLDEGRFVASAPADADAAGAEISAEDVGDAELPATLTDDQVEEILAPLRLAMESKSPKVIRAALAALQRLIAHGMLSGDADLRDEDAGGGDASSAPAVSSASAAASASASSAAAAPRPMEPMPTPRRWRTSRRRTRRHPRSRRSRLSRLHHARRTVVPSSRRLSRLPRRPSRR